MESNSKLYLLVSYIGFLAPFLLRGLTWAMLYVWTKNYPQVVGTCSGHHGQLTLFVYIRRIYLAHPHQAEKQQAVK